MPAAYIFLPATREDCTVLTYLPTLLSIVLTVIGLTGMKWNLAVFSFLMTNDYVFMCILSIVSHLYRSADLNVLPTF